MASTHEPIQLQVAGRLFALLRAGVNDHLADCAQDPLPASAFAPIKPGPLSQDKIAVLYCGTMRPREINGRNAVTIATRDILVKLEVYIWCVGASDVLAQARAVACEYAVQQIVELPANRNLGGLLEAPAALGESEVPLAAAKGGQLFWHITIPILCPVRVTRPEQER